ncbi:MAG: nitrate reductase cytochrome c-type subunit, partial [Deltaproteobacteria bacterium]|nr:nitrate reductase cytochrome c-type subunit [Deltaproteobacteria bacterium]
MMEKPDRKLGKIFLGFVGICVLAFPLIVFFAFSYQPVDLKAAMVESGTLDFDEGGKAVFESYGKISNDYLAGISTERTLSEYYSRRQYVGSPPYIPHKIWNTDDAKNMCLTCHARGGWTEELKRNAPITPHPEQTYCRQCHAGITVDSEFVQNNWMSVPPPRLGRSYLPG